MRLIGRTTINVHELLLRIRIACKRVVIQKYCRGGRLNLLALALLAQGPALIWG